MAPTRLVRTERALVEQAFWVGVASVVIAASLGCSRPVRRPSDGAAASGAIEGLGFDASPTAALADAAVSEPACTDPGPLILFASPDHPIRGQPLRVVAVAEHSVDARLTLASGEVSVETADRQQGPPYFWFAEVTPKDAGTWSASLARLGCGNASMATRQGAVGPRAPAARSSPRTALWTTRLAWSPAIENRYSAWIQHLFDAPLDTQPTWGALHEVLRDRQRNFLFDHLGQAEDEAGVVLRPDCADLPYFLRAYFAFKLGLPFGWSRCSRGEPAAPPRCEDFATSEQPFPPVGDKPPSPPAWADPNRDMAGPWNDNLKRLGEFFRTTLANAARSGAGRTPADEQDSDYYPIALSGNTLRPGVIFGDPYGHVLVVVQRVPQAPSHAGVLLAVDGQPDGTVARKRFWRGNFLFAIDPALGSAGFKRFRPIARDKQGRLARPDNAALADFSPTDQSEAGVEGFYDKVEDVLSPAPLDPSQALLETLQALEEQVKARVVSVENGRRFLASGGPPAEMPDGDNIFETIGEWEDFSTPSRDLRLLIAIDVARSLPSRVERRPGRYAMPVGEAPDRLRASLEERLASELRERKFSYTRTDGSAWELSLDDVAGRQGALEVAYNPNDCVETRWGAPAGSAEISTCAGHAPAEQRTKMETYRQWFHDRRRPVR